MIFNRTLFKYISFGLCLAFIGCASKTAYRDVLEDEPTYNVKTFQSPSDQVYTSLVKTLLVKKFMLEEENKEDGMVVARRSFKKGKRTFIIVIQARLLPENEKTTLFLNALETTERIFVADRTRFFMFVIPLPGGGGKQASTAKEGENVIQDKAFYDEFFNRIEKELSPDVPEEPMTEPSETMSEKATEMIDDAPDTDMEEPAIEDEPSQDMPEELDSPSSNFST